MTQQDVDFQKIQVLSSSYQGWFSFKVSLIAGGIVGALILTATMYYQNIVNLYGAYLGYAIVTVGALCFIWDIRKAHDEHISFINGLMLRIEKGEKLESIEELRKLHGKSAKTEKMKPKSNSEKLQTEQHRNSLNMQSERSQDSDRVDALFRIALVLLGILASAVFQFNTDATTVSYVVRVTTLPFVILIVTWIVKELLRDWTGFNKIMALTEFCWDLWTITFFYYTITFINFQSPNPLINSPISAGLLLIPYIVFILLVRFTYRRNHADKEYFKNPLWSLFSIVLFSLTYILLVFVVFPFEFL